MIPKESLEAPQPVKKPQESARGLRPSRTKIVSGDLCGGGGADFCVGKSHFPEQKSLPCSFRARKSVGFQRKLVGVVVAGELAPPSTSLAKSLF